jgi:hypothetical protein
MALSMTNYGAHNLNLLNYVPKNWVTLFYINQLFDIIMNNMQPHQEVCFFVKKYYPKFIKFIDFHYI